VALAEVLLTRAVADGGFEDALASWWEQARGIQVSGDVANTVSGGTQYGPVLQGRDFTGLTFTTAPPPAPGPPQEPRT
jgi:ABC-type glycerol-3-phosphate transport system substrate-binding protein